MGRLLDSRAKVLEYEAKQRLVEKEIELAKLQSQPPRKPLTEAEILRVTPNNHQFISAFKAGVRFAEAAHGIKGEA